MRLLWASGPGDVIASYRKWKAGEDTETEVSITFSAQFFDLCRQSGAEARVIGWHPRAERIKDGPFIVEHRPKRAGDGAGFAYHLVQLGYGLRLMASAITYRADVVVVDSGATHYFLLAPLRLLGIHVIPCLHNAVWPTGFYPASRVKRAVLRLDGLFWRWFAAATVCVSPEQQRQVRQLAGRPRGGIFEMRGMFRRGYLDRLPPGDALPAWPFRVLYAGRVERDKGALDMLDIVAGLDARYPGRIECRICGDGAALPELRAAVAQRGMEDRVRVTGRLDRRAMSEAYAWCHAVVIPTRSGSGEGLPLVAQEAVLCGRPFVASPLSNALDVLGEAAIEARPDDVASYVEALDALIRDRSLYARKCAACVTLQAQFYDRRNGFTAVLGRALASLGYKVAPCEGGAPKGVE